MSSDNGKPPATRTTSGLESIALEALQHLQKPQGTNLREPDPAVVQSTVLSTDYKPCWGAPARIVSADPEASESDNCIPRTFEPQKEVKVEANKSVTSISSTSEPVAPIKVSSASHAPSVPSMSTSTSDDKQTSIKEIEDTIKAADHSEALSDPKGWLQQTENLYQALPPIERCGNEIVVQPNDVLCGRGGETNHHLGNVQYRALVKAFQKLYLLAKRRDKPKIAQCIVVTVRRVNGRFLKREKKPGGGSIWVDVGNVKAREKTSQALREGAPDLRESVTTSTAPTTTNDNEINVLPQERKETTFAPPTTPVEAMETLRGWSVFDKLRDAYKPASSATLTPPTFYSQDPDTRHLASRAFTAAAAGLINHPIFQQLDSDQQQQAILHEFAQATASVAVSKVEAATRNSVSTPIPQKMNSHEHPYYRHLLHNHLGYDFRGIDALKKEVSSPIIISNGHRNTKKRPAPSISPPSVVSSMGTGAPAKSSRLTSPPTVVSDTGSEESSSSSASSCSSLSLLFQLTNNYEMLASSNSSIKQIKSNNTTKGDRGTVAPSAVRRGSRLKKIKARMDDETKIGNFNVSFT